MATAVAGGAAAPGAERGREPAWRRDPAGAAGGGAGGRRLGPGHRPRAVRLRGCPGPAPAFVPPEAGCAARAPRRRRRAGLDPGPRPASPASTRHGSTRRLLPETWACRPVTRLPGEGLRWGRGRPLGGRGLPAPLSRPGECLWSRDGALLLYISVALKVRKKMASRDGLVEEATLGRKNSAIKAAE